MDLRYSHKTQNQEKVAKAMGRDFNISLKKAVVVCDNISGMKLDEAIKLLEEVMEIKTPLKFLRHQAGVGHKTGLGMAKYPEKAASHILGVLLNARANAEFKGYDADKLKILSIQANRGLTRKRRKPKGRWKAWKTQLVNVQVIVKEKT